MVRNAVHSLFSPAVHPLLFFLVGGGGHVCIWRRRTTKTLHQISIMQRKIIVNCCTRVGFPFVPLDFHGCVCVYLFPCNVFCSACLFHTGFCDLLVLFWFSDLRRFRTYKGRSVRDLLRAMRNKVNIQIDRRKIHSLNCMHYLPLCSTFFVEAARRLFWRSISVFSSLATQAMCTHTCMDV